MRDEEGQGAAYLRPPDASEESMKAFLIWLVTDAGSRARARALSSRPKERWSMWWEVLTAEKSNEWRAECGETCSVPGARVTSM